MVNLNLAAVVRQRNLARLARELDRYLRAQTSPADWPGLALARLLRVLVRAELAGLDRLFQNGLVRPILEEE